MTRIIDTTNCLVCGQEAHRVLDTDTKWKALPAESLPDLSLYQDGKKLEAKLGKALSAEFSRLLHATSDGEAALSLRASEHSNPTRPVTLGGQLFYQRTIL
jgi:hypothetical protein